MTDTTEPRFKAPPVPHLSIRQIVDLPLKTSWPYYATTVVLVTITCMVLAPIAELVFR